MYATPHSTDTQTHRHTPDLLTAVALAALPLVALVVAAHPAPALGALAGALASTLWRR